MIYYRPEYFTFKILNIFKTDMQEKDFLIASFFKQLYTGWACSFPVSYDSADR